LTSIAFGPDWFPSPTVSAVCNRSRRKAKCPDRRHEPPTADSDPPDRVGRRGVAPLACFWIDGRPVTVPVHSVAGPFHSFSLCRANRQLQKVLFGPTSIHSAVTPPLAVLLLLQKTLLDLFRPRPRRGRASGQRPFRRVPNSMRNRPSVPYSVSCQTWRPASLQISPGTELWYPEMFQDLSAPRGPAVLSWSAGKMFLDLYRSRASSIR
jgi:hypothetical protein